MPSTKVLNIKTGKMENCTVGIGCKKHAHIDAVKSLSSASEEVLDFKWYRFDQNNSGGSFAEPALNVIVKAKNAEEANKIAVESGFVYFDPEFKKDCECCGNRWYKFNKNDNKSNGDSIFANQEDAIDAIKKEKTLPSKLPLYVVVE